MRDLHGKVAVITGAGSGIGAGVARACADQGMTVAVVDVNAQRASGTAAEIVAEGGKATSFEVDVRSPSAMGGLAEAVFTQFGGCHLLHNNAGVCPLGRAWDHAEEEWQNALDVNLMGAVNAVNSFVPRLLEQAQHAHIVNTVSAAALRYVPSEALYNATKFALLGFTESLYRDLAPHGIGVSALVPGGVSTNISETMLGTGASLRSRSTIDPLLSDLVGGVDVAHVTPITPEQVGQLVLEGIGKDDFYIVTHPGSASAVRERHAGIEQAFDVQRRRHPELP
jgi:NAD(P)-dependent dehydrogenase (short-subunit alcohol dehydrogenase family)